MSDAISRVLVALLIIISAAISGVNGSLLVCEIYIDLFITLLFCPPFRPH